ncbi:aminotransferase class I/II-fold pyridoxal phosphate-dependent enzyme [Pseudomonas sp. N40(2020)]|uniref:aminotransferase class I/II-fold pyridoxal phosphate-dependent enzyme n=1 Tax=Pseudomonas sp. N40(2020) TaxID=2767798 RepID=UPI001656B14F|nr:aminotransferase class I/II-fold pyridoxal phosphate-dependent enzyme [Pseudomonas sp. N40(2020)]MBC8995646.1 aminotransferase class I/II-fold pyridoxal phosphate-dependent enzyme [Pseudomonas sp. N40(2020)]
MSTQQPTVNWLKNRIRQAREDQQQLFDAGLNGLKLAQREGKEIELSSGERLTEFLSCSYLGLECDPRLIQGAVDAVETFGVQFAAARTRALLPPMRELDEQLNRIFQGHAVTFNSVGSAHLGCLPLLGSGELPSYPLRRGPSWIVDRAAHASMQVLQGILWQFGPVQRCDCRDMEQVEQACSAAVAAGNTPIILTDSIGSMRGVYPINRLLQLAERFEGYLYADDAHGTSIYGVAGGGYALASGDERLRGRLILLSSLSKAFGATGGAITVLTADDAEMIRRHASTYTFGGPLSMGGVGATVASGKIHLSPELGELQAALWRNVALIDDLLGPVLGNHEVASPIRFVRVGAERDAISLALYLRRQAIAVTTALFPVVAKGEAILRLAISANHSQAQLACLANAVNGGFDELGIRQRGSGDGR